MSQADTQVLENDFAGYGLAMFVDEHAQSDEFIVYMEEATIPPDEGQYQIRLVADDGSRTPLGSARPDVCCGHAEDEDPNEPPHAGRLMFNAISPTGQNYLARHGGVELSYEGKLVFQDAFDGQTLFHLRQLLVHDPARGMPGHAIMLKRQAQRLDELADDANLAGRAAEALALLVEVHQTLPKMLDAAQHAAGQPNARPSLPLRLRQIQNQLEGTMQNAYGAAYEAWSATLPTRLFSQSDLIRTTTSLSKDLLEIYKLCQQMSWLALSPSS